MATEETIDEMLALAGGVLDKEYIMDAGVRREVCRMLLEREELFTLTGKKFEMAELMEMIAPTAGVVDTRPTININATLTAGERAMLTHTYPHVSLVFRDGLHQGHGLAYASRIIETHELLARVPAHTPTVGDWGGNYMVHAGRAGAKGRSFEVHCCNLVEGATEHHRQVQRQVGIERGLPYSSYCVNGVRNCVARYSHSISVNALPLIDPGEIVSIFRIHETTIHEAFFHFDPAMNEGETAGYMAPVGQEWEVVGDEFHFRFRGDGSLPYVQKVAWTLEYARPWIRTADDWEYVLYNSVRVVAPGRCKTTIYRLDKNTVGYIPPRGFLRWVGGEDEVVLPVPRYNPKLGPVTSPASYEVGYRKVPVDLFNFAFFRGIANDSDRPDLPLRRATIQDAVTVYKVNRKVNGVSITEEAKLTSAEVSDVSTGVYLAVLSTMAKNRAMLKVQTDQMLRVQNRWGKEGFFWLLGKCATAAALTPLLALCDKFEDAVDAVALMMRRDDAEPGMLGAPCRLVPYVELPAIAYDPVNRVVPLVAGIGEKPFVPPVEEEEEGGKPEPNPDEVVKHFYTNYKDIFPAEIKESMREKLFGDDPSPREATPPPLEARDVGGVGALPEDEDESELPTRAEAEEYIIENRDQWIAEFRALQDQVPEALWNADDEPEEAPDKVLKDVHLRIQEFALHCFDLNMCAEGQMREWLKAHWNFDRPNYPAMERDNELKEIGAAFYQVEEGYVVGLPEGVAYDVLMDPVTRTVIPVVRKNGKQYVGKTAMDVVYALDMMRIHNSKRAGVAAMKMLRGPDKMIIPDVAYDLVSGIAGSGKTRELTRDFTLRDIYATGPRASAAKQLAFLAKLPKFANAGENLARRVRTLDSFLLNRMPLAETLMIDEALMTHSAVIFILAAKCRAKRVRVSGDSKQIPMIDRGSGHGQLAYSVNKHWTSVTYLNVSDRMPCDATRLNRKRYPAWRQPLIKTRSPVRRSMFLHVVPDTNSRIYTDVRQYETILTFLQSDKYFLLSKPGHVEGKAFNAADGSYTQTNRPVLTVHEAQGDTYPVSKIIRVNKFTGDIFDSAAHRYVATSRHLIESHYVTPVVDPLSKEYAEAMRYTEDELDEVQDELSDELVGRIRKLKQDMAGHAIQLEFPG